MKKIYYVLLLLPFLGFSQSVEPYVVIPNRYTFQKSDNEHQLNALTKFLFEKYHFKTTWEDKIPVEMASVPCQLLKADVINDSGMFVSKLYFTLTDCTGKQVFVSEIGRSRLKEYKDSYQEALRNAFASSKNLGSFRTNFQSVAGNQQKAKAVVEPQKVKEEIALHVLKPTNTHTEVLYAQPTENGFQLVDKTPKIVMHIQKTSLKEVYIAKDEQNNHGVLYKNGEDYVFEYYQNGKQIREVVSIKF